MNVKANVTLLSSEQLEGDVASARRLAEHGPVFIVSSGEVSHVLLTKQDYDGLHPPEKQLEPPAEEASKRQSLAEALAYDGEDGDFEWEPPRFGGVYKPADLD